MIVREYLDGTNPEQYHIFDSHQEMMGDRGVDHKDQDYLVYSYNVHKNNKPKSGDVFLYRRPGKSTANRKFNIYGGGVIARITEPDREGNVLATITTPFRLKEPIEQGDERIESFTWTSKNKAPGSWAHFWSQYGMNVIDEHDFYGLVGDLEITVPVNTNPYNAGVKEASEEIWEPAAGFDVTGFRVDIVADDDQAIFPLVISWRPHESTSGGSVVSRSSLSGALYADAYETKGTVQAPRLCCTGPIRTEVL